MNSTSILRSPILSEKAYKQMEKGIYTFMVDKKSNKKKIAQIVERQFNVKVVKVNVSKKAQKTKKISGTRKEVKVGGGKKATVWLASGQSIAVLAPKAEKKEKVSKGSKVKEASKDKKESKDKEPKKGLLSRFTKSKEKGKERSK